MKQEIITWSVHDDVDLDTKLLRIISRGDNIQAVIPTQYGDQSLNSMRVIAAKIIVNILA